MFFLIPLGIAAVSALSTSTIVGGAAATALADLVSDEQLCEDFILPEAFDPRVAETVSQAVKSHIK